MVHIERNVPELGDDDDVARENAEIARRLIKARGRQNIWEQIWPSLSVAISFSVGLYTLIIGPLQKQDEHFDERIGRLETKVGELSNFAARVADWQVYREKATDSLKAEIDQRSKARDAQLDRIMETFARQREVDSLRQRMEEHIRDSDERFKKQGWLDPNPFAPPPILKTENDDGNVKARRESGDRALHPVR